jgi:hypothetical protein
MTQTLVEPGPASTAVADLYEALTVERALYVLLLLVALGMRLAISDLQPLTAAEAANAWAAWRAAMATPVAAAPPPASALLYGVQSILFWLLGGGDALARLGPALVGAALVVLPWWWRSLLGRVGALTLALVFAIDSWLTLFGRTADGTGLAIFLGFLALTGFWQWRAGGRAAWATAAAVASGLLLTAGVQGWSLLPVVVGFWLLFLWPGYRSGELHFRRRNLVWFGGALLLGATGFGLRADAIPAVGTSLTEWLSQFDASARVHVATWPFVRLVVDQPFVLVFGVGGLLALWLAGGATLRRLALFLTLWAAWGIFLWLLPGRAPGVLPLVGLPLALAAAWGVDRIAGLPAGQVRSVEIWLVVLAQVVMLIACAVYLAAVLESTSLDTQLLLVGALIVGLMVLVWALFGFWAGWRSALKVGGLFYAILLLLLTVRPTWQLNYQAGLMRPDGFWRVTTDPDVRRLGRDVQRISSLRRGDPTVAEVQVVAGGAPDPVLGWYLRDQQTLRWLAAPDAAALAQGDPSPAQRLARAPIVIAPASAMLGDASFGRYVGSEYVRATVWTPDMLPALPPVDPGVDLGLPADDLARLRDQRLWGDTLRPRLEWLVYRTVTQPPAMDRIGLWALAE